MSKKEKLIKRFLNNPRDFTFGELVTLLGYLGYRLDNSGSTSGSRVRFYKNGYPTIYIHRPHAYKCILITPINRIKEELKENGLL